AHESLKISIQPEARWTAAPSKMAASREGAKDHYWNVSGQQILAMGKEPGGIDEIWIHPIMALRDFALGVKYRNSNEIVWLNELTPVVTKSPGAFERNYTLRDGSKLREYIVADLKDPLMAVRFDWD